MSCDSLGMSEGPGTSEERRGERHRKQPSGPGDATSTSSRRSANSWLTHSSTRPPNEFFTSSAASSPLRVCLRPKQTRLQLGSSCGSGTLSDLQNYRQQMFRADAKGAEEEIKQRKWERQQTSVEQSGRQKVERRSKPGRYKLHQRVVQTVPTLLETGVEPTPVWPKDGDLLASFQSADTRECCHLVAVLLKTGGCTGRCVFRRGRERVEEHPREWSSEEKVGETGRWGEGEG